MASPAIAGVAALLRSYAYERGYPGDARTIRTALERSCQVRDLNILVQSFPSNLIASPFGFKTGEFFEIEDAAERAVPKVSFEKSA
jgi:hypothetical protein